MDGADDSSAKRGRDQGLESGEAETVTQLAEQTAGVDGVFLGRLRCQGRDRSVLALVRKNNFGRDELGQGKDR
jgi:hypothetical protein